MAIYETISGGLFLDEEYDLVGIVDESVELTINLEGKSGRSVSVIFKGVAAYCRMNESFSLAVWDDAANNSPGCGVLTRVDGGDFINYFHLQSYGAHSKARLNHYVLFALDDLVHVITFDVPKVRVMSES